ncbi:MAG: 50S ribosomal protein L22 [Candidatus Latescibacteria bacterium]|nr:50S ribosomal protein L22 [Candidatus Latescibacterota bacterium]
MEAVAKARYVRGSARKMRQVMDIVRGKNVEDALNILRFTRKKSALALEKLLRSAVSNAMNIYGDKLPDPHDLTITEVKCDDGPMLKRISARAMGRAYRIRKRSCHMKIVVSSEES